MVHPNLRYQINLRVLKRLNAQILSILNTASHAVLYEFMTDENQWSKLNIEGPMFIYRKSQISYTGLFLLNRLDLENFEMELLNCVVTYKDPYIMIQDKEKIYGIWIHDSIERETMYSFTQKGITMAENPPTPEMDRPPGFEDRSDNSNVLMDLLQRAKSKVQVELETEPEKIQKVVKSNVAEYMVNYYNPLDRYSFESELIRILQVLCY
eukprot:NODE_216_length_12483_cov_2.137516.p6 type:complete len:210 gc:universal NODE_216_length_12483_cov_2.137516:838-209(-)